ncbi:MAG: AfsR/SARP family transcriptional regulator [Pseudonocardiaceae bacterium]
MLGYFRLRVRGRDTALPAAAQRLVALLALRGRTSRSRAAGTLWPETTEHRALASLRTAIWRVNQAAPALVWCPGGDVDLDDTVSIDIRQLVQYGLAALSPDGADRGDIPVAHLGVNLIEAESELLPDWEEEWLLTDRQRLRQLRLHLLEIIAERLAAQEHFGLAMEAALAALRADDLRESAHRAVIKIHIAEGNLVEARRAYGTCRTLLVHGLGIEPSPMAARLLVASKSLGGPPKRGPSPLRATEAASAAAGGAAF